MGDLNGSNSSNLLWAVDSGSVSGISESTKNNSAVFLDRFNSILEVGLFPYHEIVMNTVVHEIGHQWGLNKGINDHIDEDVDAEAHSGGDHCIMSYNHIDLNDIVEFDYDSLCDSSNSCMCKIKKHKNP